MKKEENVLACEEFIDEEQSFMFLSLCHNKKTDREIHNKEEEAKKLPYNNLITDTVCQAVS